MTKIETFKLKNANAIQLARNVAQALGRDSVNNDKHSVTASFAGLAKSDWSPIQLSIHMSHGYFGSSSGYSDTSTEMGVYLAKAFTAHAAMLMDFAVTLAQQDAEVARKDAEDEARLVLQETAA